VAFDGSVRKDTLSAWQEAIFLFAAPRQGHGQLPEVRQNQAMGM
jgi:hypothetical protein